MRVESERRRTEEQKEAVDLLDRVLSFSLVKVGVEKSQTGVEVTSLRGFIEKIKENKVNVLLVIADAIAGKTHIIRRIAAEFPKTDLLDWGEVFQAAIKEKKIPALEYGEFSKDHLETVSRLFEKEIYRTLKDRKNSGNLVIVKAPAICMATINGELVGTNRAYSSLMNLTHKAGKFNSLKYRVAGIGIAAEPAAREKGKKVRFEVKAAASSQELRQIYNKYGEDVSSLTDEELWIYCKIGANVKASEQIELHSNMLAYAMAIAGKFPTGRKRMMQVWTYPKNLAAYPRTRFLILSQYVLPEILQGAENFNLSPELTFVGRNIHVKRLPVSGTEINRPIRDRYNLK